MAFSGESKYAVGLRLNGALVVCDDFRSGVHNILKVVAQNQSRVKKRRVRSPVKQTIVHSQLPFR